MKAQEVKRLQEAVQEKSKQLKVVELELARYKNKPAGAAPATGARPAAAPAAARPAASNLANSFLGDDDEGATRVNAIPDQRPPPPAAKPAPPVAGKPAPARPAVAITAATAQKRPQEGNDRTVVMSTGTLPPASGDDDVDFTSIVDNLGES